MTTFKISIYKDGVFIRDIWADFITKKAALNWTLEAYKNIGVNLNLREIEVINPLA